MIDWYTLLIPVAVFAVLLLFRLVGCSFAPSAMVIQPYADDVLQDNPIVYYRMQETAGSTNAADEKNFLNASYGVADSSTLGLLSGADAVTYRSLAIANPSLQVGSLSILPKEPEDKSVQFNGGFLSAFGALGDQSRFTVDALVFPQWDIVNERNFYCVIDRSHFESGLGSTAANNTGFAIFAGPDNPFDPASPICWQLWIGTGDELARGSGIATKS